VPDILAAAFSEQLECESSVRLESRGVRELEGVPGPWQVFAVVS
jgi:hypothetical protein